MRLSEEALASMAAVMFLILLVFIAAFVVALHIPGAVTRGNMVWWGGAFDALGVPFMATFVWPTKENKMRDAKVAR